MTNNRPIIGILAQETSIDMKNEFETATSYVAASYVKAIEGSGARVIPIFLDKPEEYYSSVVTSINGLLLPGGNTWFYKDDDKTPKDYGYLRAAELLYKEVKKVNNCNNNFPVLGICLGFEVLLFLDAEKEEIRERFKNGRTVKSTLKLDFLKEHLLDQLWQECLYLSEEPLCYFSHQFYITERRMSHGELKEKWNIIATTTVEEVTFVSIIESKEYPILGLQFHPEKNSFEWKENLNIPHHEKAISSSRFFFDWLVNSSRKNVHYFKDKKQEFSSLINQFPKTVTIGNKSFDELYLFNSKNDRICKFCN